jgi:tryptophanyl-tRNA synthetase
MRPTGALHLGNLHGALKNWIELQNSDDYDCYYFVADWHALTSEYSNTDPIRENITDMVIDWLSAGLDPARSTLFIQSRIKEHAELFLILSMITPLPWLERNPTYKEIKEELVEKVVTRRDVSRNPLFDTMFILQNMETPGPAIPGLQLAPYAYENKTAKFDLTFIVVEQGESLYCAVEYSTNLFKEETIRRFIGYFKTILSAVNENPRQRLCAIEIIPAVDIRNGRCVRLYQGDYQQETVFSDDPVDVA